MQAMSRQVTPSNWKQSAATGVVRRKRSRVFTVRHRDSNERPNWRWTGRSQLSSLQRDSAVTCREGEGKRAAAGDQDNAGSFPRAEVERKG